VSFSLTLTFQIFPDYHFAEVQGERQHWGAMQRSSNHEGANKCVSIHPPHSRCFPLLHCHFRELFARALSLAVVNGQQAGVTTRATQSPTTLTRRSLRSSCLRRLRFPPDRKRNPAVALFRHALAFDKTSAVMHPVSSDPLCATN
jgi:hypothetical protein